MGGKTSKHREEGDGGSHTSIFGAEFASKHVQMKDFELCNKLGEGAFGTVFRVRKKDTNQYYALKMLDKHQILEMDAVAQCRAEEALQERAGNNCKFIVSLRFAFETEEKLCIVLDYISGGDLFDHLRKARRFSESRAKLYAAETCVAVEYLHGLNIIYRDLKMENILLDSEGHIRLTDFGLAKELKGLTRTTTVCGTPEFMAPEVLEKQAYYDTSVDWWTFGVLIYVMVTGHYPFAAKNRKELEEKVLHEEILIPAYVSADVKDLIQQLTCKDVARRLRGARVRAHVWFADIDWSKVERKEYMPEFKPGMDEPAVMHSSPIPGVDWVHGGQAGAEHGQSPAGHRNGRRRHQRVMSVANITPMMVLPSSSSSSSPEPTPVAGGERKSRRHRHRSRGGSRESMDETETPTVTGASAGAGAGAGAVRGPRGVRLRTRAEFDPHARSTPNMRLVDTHRESSSRRLAPHVEIESGGEEHERPHTAQQLHKESSRRRLEPVTTSGADASRSSFPRVSSRPRIASMAVERDDRHGDGGGAATADGGMMKRIPSKSRLADLDASTPTAAAAVAAAVAAARKRSSEDSGGDERPKSTHMGDGEQQHERPRTRQTIGAPPLRKEPSSHRHRSTAEMGRFTPSVAAGGAGAAFGDDMVVGSGFGSGGGSGGGVTPTAAAVVAAPGHSAGHRRKRRRSKRAKRASVVVAAAGDSDDDYDYSYSHNESDDDREHNRRVPPRTPSAPPLERDEPQRGRHEKLPSSEGPRRTSPRPDSIAGLVTGPSASAMTDAAPTHLPLRTPQPLRVNASVSTGHIASSSAHGPAFGALEREDDSDERERSGGVVVHGAAPVVARRSQPPSRRTSPKTDDEASPPQAVAVGRHTSPKRPSSSHDVHPPVRREMTEPALRRPNIPAPIVTGSAGTAEYSDASGGGGGGPLPATTPLSGSGAADKFGRLKALTTVDEDLSVSASTPGTQNNTPAMADADARRKTPTALVSPRTKDGEDEPWSSRPVSMRLDELRTKRGDTPKLNDGEKVGSARPPVAPLRRGDSKCLAAPSKGEINADSFVMSDLSESYSYYYDDDGNGSDGVKRQAPAKGGDKGRSTAKRPVATPSGATAGGPSDSTRSNSERRRRSRRSSTAGGGKKGSREGADLDASRAKLKAKQPVRLEDGDGRRSRGVVMTASSGEIKRAANLQRENSVVAAAVVGGRVTSGPRTMESAVVTAAAAGTPRANANAGAGGGAFNNSSTAAVAKPADGARPHDALMVPQRTHNLLAVGAPGSAPTARRHRHKAKDKDASRTRADSICSDDSFSFSG